MKEMTEANNVLRYELDRASFVTKHGTDDNFKKPCIFGILIKNNKLKQ